MHVGVVSLHTNLDRILDLANALHKIGVSVSLYLSQANVVRVVEDSARPVESLYERGLLPSEVRVRLFQVRRMRDPGSFFLIRSIAQALRADGVDVVHIAIGGGEIWVALLSVLLRDVPVTSNMEIPKPNVGEYPPAFVVRAANRLLALGSDLIIVNGTDHIPLVQTMYGVPEARIHYVPLGPFTSFLKWVKEPVSEEPGMVLFFGRANRHKGLEYLVRAQPSITRRVPQARFVIAGHGDDIARCRELIQDGSRFEVHEGFIPSEFAVRLFQQAAVFALPYISATTSGVLMTAYTFAKPVVATRVGSLPEYVREGVTGLLVPPADVEQLADAIVRLLADDDLRHRLGQNAARWVSEELSWDNVARQTLDAYEKAISLHRSRR